MKIRSWVFWALAATVPAHAQEYLTGFGDGPGDPPYTVYIDNNGTEEVADLAGQNDWEINDSTRALSFMIEDRNGSQAGGFGGFFDAPAGPPGSRVTLDRGISLPMANLAFSIDFSVSPFTDPLFSGQDTFGFSFTDSGSNEIFSLSFEPFNPQQELLDIRYSLSGDPSVSTTNAISLGGDYTLSLNFSRVNTDNIRVSASLANITFSRIIPGAGDASLDRFGIFYETVDSSDSFISFDNLSLRTIPEPSGSALALLAMTGCCLRRGRKQC